MTLIIDEIIWGKGDFMIVGNELNVGFFQSGDC